MRSSGRPPRILQPATMPELLAMLQDYPGATPFAGGTYIMRTKRGRRFPQFDPVMISLDRIEDLQRIARSERYIDIGATATIASVLKIGSSILPDILARALRSIAYLPTRNQATLGGNVCVSETRLTAFPVLLLLDAQIELRRGNHGRWVSISRFVHPDGTLNREPDEICTRIRIPLGAWDVQEYRSTHSGIEATPWGLSFCGVAETRKGSLSEIRFAFGSMGKTFIRNREIEAELISRRLPLQRREIDGAVEQLVAVIDAMTPGPTEIQRQAIPRFLAWFLSNLFGE